MTDPKIINLELSLVTDDYGVVEAVLLATPNVVDDKKATKGRNEIDRSCHCCEEPTHLQIIAYVFVKQRWEIKSWNLISILPLCRVGTSVEAPFT